MRLRSRNWIRAGAAVGLLNGLSACASPGDVQARYDTARDTYAADMATARAWDVHTLGIPASGWVAILIAAVSIVGVALIIAGVAFRDRRRDRRAHEHELAMAREATLRSVTERGPCPNCGLAVPELLKRIREQTP